MNNPFNFNQLKKEVDQLPPASGIKLMLEQTINALMQQEREIYLSDHKDTKGNGSYQRQVYWDRVPLNLTVPRDRSGEFRSSLLPDKYHRVYDEMYEQILSSLIVNGYSRSSLYQTLRSLDLPYNEQSVQKLTDTLHREAKQFVTRRIPADICALFIDGYHCEIKDESDGRIKQAVLYVALSIDLCGNKDVVGWYPVFGHESAQTWKLIFSDMIDRGLKRTALVVSDDLSGIHEVITTLFPKADHQLCLVHLQRSIYRNMAKPDAIAFNRQVQQIKQLAGTKEAAIGQFNAALAPLVPKYKPYVSLLKEKASQYFACKDYPIEVQSYFSTTNAVESVNSSIEKIRVRMGGFFQSEKVIDINIYLFRNRMKNKKWKHAAPRIKNHEYDLLQLFNRKYL